jgi:hypothetical protein
LTREVHELQPSPVLATLGLDRLAPAEAARWRRRLKKTARPCGCKSGAALSVAALAGWPAWILATHPPHTPFAAGLALAAYPFAIVAAGAIGKLAGIFVGRWRHRHVRRQLRHHVSRLTSAAGG